MMLDLVFSLNHFNFFDIQLRLCLLKTFFSLFQSVEAISYILQLRL